MNLIFLTIYTPPNWLDGSIITFGSCMVSSLIGGLLNKIITSDKSKPKSKKRRKK